MKVGALLGRRLLVALLPGDEWSRELVEELDAELERLVAAGRVRWAGGWYARQLVSLRTLHFIWLVRCPGGRRGGRVVGRMVTRMSGVDGAWRDLVQATRSLRRAPRAALVIVLTLGLGIGSLSAMFGVADRLFLSGPPHVRAPEEILRVYLTFDDAGGLRTGPWIPFRTAKALQEGSHSFSALTLYRRTERLSRVGEEVRPLQVSEVDGNYFDLLGVVPALGRFFRRGATGGDGGPAVISWRLARSSFGPESAALGQSIDVGGLHHTVVGVTPEGFSGPQLQRVDIWVPMERSLAPNRNWFVVGRIRGGTRDDLLQPAREAEAIHQGTDPGGAFRWAREGRVSVAALGSDDGGAMSAEAAITRMLLALVSILLLTACVNVVNLLLARVTRRRREVIVRLALGIGRWRLVRLLVLESLTLSVAGGLFGIPVAYGSGLVLRRVLLPEVAWASSPLNARVLAVTAIVAILAGLVLGLLPARHANRTNLTSGLASDRVTPGRGRTGAQSALATAQLALSSALLVCAGLFLKSFWTIRVTDLGFAGDVWAVRLRSLDEAAYPEGSDGERALYEGALETVRDLEGRDRSALTVGLPFVYNFGLSIWIPGLDSVPQVPGGGPYISAVSGGYFGAVGTPILRGAGISEGDVAAGEPVAVVSRFTARTLWPGGDPLGKCVRIGSESTECLRVVGVAADVHRQGYREPASLQLYVPLGRERGHFGGMALVVRPTRESASEASRLATALRGLDARADYIDIARLDSLVDAQIRPWRLGAVVLTFTAGMALLISLVGVYGTLSYAVAQRRREMGVRLALGATTGSIRKLVLRTGLLSGGIGVAAGFGLVLGGSRWLAPLLFETPVADPLVMISVGVLLVVSAVAACVLPAGEAARVDPLASLRSSA